MKTLRNMLTAAAICSLSTAASADVIYNWHPTNSGPNFGTIGGQLSVTDQAYEHGSLLINYAPPYSNAKKNQYGLKAYPNSPINYASLTFTPAGTGNGYINPTTSAFTDFGEKLAGNLVFNADGTLSGYLNEKSPNLAFTNSGFKKNWNVDKLTGQSIDPCGGQYGCSAGKGYWQKQESAEPVPTAGVWGLYLLSALGIFGLAATRKKNLRNAV